MSEENSTKSEEKLGRTGHPAAVAGRARRKSADYYDQLLRLKAEFDNYRKRVEKEKVEARQWGKQDVIMPLLSLVDVFEQAMAQAENAKDVKQSRSVSSFCIRIFPVFSRVRA